MNSLADNGEAFLQKCVIAATAGAEALVALEIGANQGEWTLCLLGQVPADRRNTESLRIEVFEPVLGTAAMFRNAVVTAYDGDCVTLHEHAMSDADGSTGIAFYAEGAGTNTVHFQSLGREPERTITVALKRLSDVCAGPRVDCIDLVKCDPERHDAMIIRGAYELLSGDWIGVFQFEYHHRRVISRSLLRDVFELIDGTDYALVCVDPTELTLFEAWHPEFDRYFQSIYALIHTRALDWASVRRGRFDRSNAYA